MDYITTKKPAKNWEITDKIIAYYCSFGRIKGANKMGNTWLIPVDAEKPTDGRDRNGKVGDGENK
ncbi:transposase [Clostridium acetobutylicum]|nr:transposase [Clostridium acetobutylicum]